jgi:hypothetical protein
MINHKHKFIFIHIPKTAGHSIERAFGAWTGKDKINYGIGMDSIKRRPIQHYNLAQLERFNFISPTENSTYFKFCFVRNPYSRIVSAWKYLKVQKWSKVSEDTSFKKFVKKSKNNSHVRPQCHWTHTRMVKNVDFIGRFENLQVDFDTICDKIGIERQELPHKNKSKHKHYTEYYDDETREIVAKKYAKDIEYFNYEFGE